MNIKIDGKTYRTIFDASGVQRFPANKLFTHLVDSGRVDLNELARAYAEGLFTQEEYLQFLIGLGYSVTGLSDLSVCDGMKIDNPVWKDDRL